MAELLAEVCRAVRRCARDRAFAAFAVLLLALAIGAATAVFSLVRAVVLRDLPFTEPDRIVWIYNARTERDRAPFSIPDLADYRAGNTTLAGLAAFVNWTANLTGGGEAERLEGTRVSGEFFRLLGARSLFGRTIEPGDEAGAQRIVVLTHGIWIRRFGGDPAILGTSIMLNGGAYAVVGVMPSGFLFPFRDAEIAVPLPLRDDPRRADRGANFLRVLARLKGSVTIADAKSDLDAIAHRLQREYPADDARKTGVNLYPLHAEIVGDYRQIVWTLFVAVILLVAIGCGNLATLLLVRTSSRTAEFAVRLSLGASSARLMRQVVVEAGVLAAAGGGLGVAAAEAAITGGRAFAPSAFPRGQEIALDVHVLTFAVGTTLAAAIVCGAVPGWMAVREAAGVIHGSARIIAGGRRGGGGRRAFLVVQVAGAAGLLLCMGLAAREFARLEHADPGFRPDRAVTVQLSLPPARYAGRDGIVRLYDAMSIRLRGIAGVRAVGAVSLLPLTGLLSTIDIAFPDRPAPPPDEVPQAHYRIASPGYFAAAGIGIVDGREFTERDTHDGRPVAVVSRTLADRHWPRQRAVGQHLQVAQGPSPPALEIVGVVQDVKQFTVDGPPTADLYVPIKQAPVAQASALVARMYWVVRSGDDGGPTVAEVRRAVRAVDADIAASSVRSLDEVFAASLGGRRAAVWLLEAFGQVAMLLAAAGVYAVAAFAARTRTREMAIRLALGASERDLISLVAANECRSVWFGIAAGLAIATAATQTLGGTLFPVTGSDPGAYVAVALTLVAVTFVAAWLPAMRAGRVDPAEALRS